jgi:glycosyltransferase involved in cell wall biosynthesis
VRLLYCYVGIHGEGNKVHIDSFMNAFASIGDEIIDGGVTVPPFLDDKSKWSVWKKISAKLIWIKRNISHLIRLSRLAWSSRPDVVLFRFTHNMFLPIFCLSFFYPVVLEVNATRSIEAPSAWKGLSSWLDKLSFRRAKRCFVVSRAIKNHLLDRCLMPSESIAVIENGVDVDVFNYNISIDELKKNLGLEDAFIVGFVGSVQPQHGIENIIALSDIMKSMLNNIVFLIVGDGKYRDQFRKMAESKGLGNDIVFTGFVRHELIQNYIALMDVALAPYNRNSQSGAFHYSPLKIFEYMAMAKPIIAPPLGQINELIEHGKSGLLIYSEDTLALKDALLQLYHDKAYRELLGANARKRVEENYTWRANAEKVRDLCQKSIQSC